MTGIAPWAAGYVGIPFVSGGRGHDGADCYGLIRLVHLEQFDRKLPVLSDDYDDAENCAETEQVMKAQRPLLAGRRVDTPVIGDICVIRFYGLAVHTGVYAGGGYVLHSLRLTGSVLQRVDDPLVSGRIEGWYRVD
ncbi:MAG: C40 family peptidase [Treponema sp.]|nr:C40 family peptidase [Treponema sp.]